MRYAASEKLEIIRLVEESHLSARRTLAKLGTPAQSAIEIDIAGGHRLRIIGG